MGHPCPESVKSVTLCQPMAMKCNRSRRENNFAGEDKTTEHKCIASEVSMCGGTSQSQMRISWCTNCHMYQCPRIMGGGLFESNIVECRIEECNWFWLVLLLVSLPMNKEKVFEEGKGHLAYPISLVCTAVVADSMSHIMCSYGFSDRLSMWTKWYLRST